MAAGEAVVMAETCACPTDTDTFVARELYYSWVCVLPAREPQNACPAPVPAWCNGVAAPGERA